MADTTGKRLREAKKRQHREMKAERKRLRKAGLLGHDNSGLFAPGELHRPVMETGPSHPGEMVGQDPPPMID